MTPDQLRDYANLIECKGPLSAKETSEHYRAHAAALEEIERLKKENDTLRGLLGNSAKPCPYCGLPAEDQAKCPSGFPGCARADDQMLSKHFADAYRAEQAERRAERLKGHAEAMANAIQFGDMAILTVAKAAAESYRASFPKVIQ